MTKQEYLTNHTGNGDTARKDLDELIERYCREQREIISDMYMNDSRQVVEMEYPERIDNAPTPEL